MEDFQKEEVNQILSPYPTSFHRLDKDHKPVRCTSLQELIDNFENGTRNRIVKQDYPYGCFVSTVFLGLNHGWFGDELWFESMMFPDDTNAGLAGVLLESYQERYETWDQALNGHQRMIDYVNYICEHGRYRFFKKLWRVLKEEF